MTERYMLYPTSAAHRRRAAVACAAVLGLPASAQAAPPAGLVGDWRLTAMNRFSEPPRRHAPTVTFRADGTLGGDDGCNSFGGAYRTDGAEIVSDDAIVTTVACRRPDDPDLDARGQAFFEAVTRARFTVRGDVLTLRTATGHRLTLRRETSK